uniref:Uncharacterized protein n=1 Tax=Arundo donax TaxID=35708 RepID=A0A0A9G095_ARUDO
MCSRGTSCPANSLSLKIRLCTRRLDLRTYRSWGLLRKRSKYLFIWLLMLL